jgi:uracil-DNA glycosylase
VIRIPRYVFPNLGLVDEKPAAQIKQPTPELRVNYMSTKEEQIASLLKEIETVDIPYKDLDNTVLYDGDIESPIMVIGEGPGENEVLQKKPFVGKSGKLLQEMLDAAGIKREKIYVTNVVVWRPPQNRTPLPAEIDLMRQYVLKHIAIIQPSVLILVGSVAYKCVSESNTPITKVRGEWFSKTFCKDIITVFHPSYLLRVPVKRKDTWRDILEARRVIEKLGHSQYLEKGLLNLS